MNESQGNKPPQRAFRCTHCQGEILVPADLAPTSAPCPHCGKLVTSPAPKTGGAVPGKRSSDTPQRLTTKAKPAAKLFAHEASPEARARELKRLEAANAPPPEPPRKKAAERKANPSKPVISRKTKEVDKAGGETRSEFEQMIDEEVRHVGRRFRRSLILVLLLAALGVVAVFRMKDMGPRTDAPSTPAAGEDQTNYLTPAFIAGDWVAEARDVLRRFINSNTSFGKAAHILRGQQLLPQLEHFQRQGLLFDLDTPEDRFQAQSLDEKDHQRGLFLMTFEDKAAEQPENAPARPLLTQSALLDPASSYATATKVHAFFKATGDGLKLDWEVYVQTKHRLLRQFASKFAVGESATFRVLIAQAKLSEGGSQPGSPTYLICDPANLADRVHAVCPGDSEAGRELSALNWVGLEGRSPITRTATLELTWAGTEETPRLVITDFFCWEFLGLGGN